MQRTKISRRHFAAVGVAAAGVRLTFADTLSARDVMTRLQTSAGTMPENSTDGFLAGDPQITVKGIATTAMATMDVLKQAAKNGLNLVVTYENAFYGQAQPIAPGGAARGGRGGGRAQTGLGPDDPVYMAKKEFIEKNGMAIFRFRDQWTARKDNPLAVGLAEAMGWSKYQTPGDPTSYQIPEVKFEALVADLRKRLNTRGGIRVIGERQASIRKVALLPGLIAIDTGLKRLPQVDLLLTGEAREWEIAEYAFDTMTAHHNKGFIMLGRIFSEDPGLRVCSNWMKTVVKEVPVQWIGTGDPYWRPAKV
jgi:putative NIF3 family GTP cyclohydrolase 1 type 2